MKLYSTKLIVVFYCVIFAINIFPTYASSSELYLDSEKNYHRNLKILNSTTHLFKEDGRPKASIGTVLYTYAPNGEVYILIGRENPTKTGAGHYCELGGSLELLKPQHAESFLAGCIRECEEESAGSYKIDTEYALKNSFTIFRQKPERDEVYIFLEAPKYISAHELMEAVNQAANPHSKEKDSFKWVSLSSLMENCLFNSQCEVQDIGGNKEVITLRPYFLDILKTNDMQAVVHAIEHFKSKKILNQEHKELRKAS